MKFTFLLTDIFIYLLLGLLCVTLAVAVKKAHLRRPLGQLIQSRLTLATLVILSLYLLVAVLDSIHFYPSVQNQATQQYSSQMHSALDYLLWPLPIETEKTYSAPFALTAFGKETRTVDHKIERFYPPLRYAGEALRQTQRSQMLDILLRVSAGLIDASLFSLVLISLYFCLYKVLHRLSWKTAWRNIFYQQSRVPHRFLWVFVWFVLCLCFSSYFLAQDYHILGTNKIGQDVFFESIKSIRTGLLIGILTTVFMLPFALLLGTMAGYFGGLFDDVIQYIYTTLSSIPGVLLIAASILSMQLFISNHPQLFPSLIQRADARLLALCLILGISSWTGLCRLLRAETLKLREMDYIQGAKSLGSSSSKIITKHILPNLLHIVIISIALDFSGLVLAEAVLSYIGVGVDPTTMSWGNMINSARLELARVPVVWWPLFSAFLFMFILVLAANIFADALRDAFDPRVYVEGHADE